MAIRLGGRVSSSGASDIGFDTFESVLSESANQREKDFG